MNKGLLFILSGPSGTGKSTLVRRLLAAEGPRLRLSISATTRPPRQIPRGGHSEVDGVHYHFWTRERFQKEIQAGGFLEWAEVFGHLYGTPKSEVEPYREQGISVLLEIDVQGAAQVWQQCPEAVSLFLRAPSLADYEQRLRDRKTESEENLQRRLAEAQRELERANEYDYQVINDALDRAVAEVQKIFHGLLEREQNA